jgi:CelD/BcsL family acetyltransferase involved in cellulose biosynthesis
LPVALLPLAVRRSLGLRVAEFACGRESNLNLALIRPGAPPLDFRALLLAAARGSPKAVDLYFLRNQPHRFGRQENPLVFSDACPSPSAAYGGSLPGHLEDRVSSRASKRASYRQRRLATLGPLAFEHAAAGRRRQEIVATLCAQKTARLSRLGRANPYATGGMRRFLDSLAERGLLEAHAMTIDDHIVATYVGLPRNGRFCVLANYFDANSAAARFSPGEALLNALLENLARRGFADFDLGIGEAQYKAAVCEEAIALYDTVLAVSPAGAVAAPLLRASVVCKRAIKQSPWLLDCLQRLRRVRSLQAVTA